jgi:hypothetical protein
MPQDQMPQDQFQAEGSSKSMSPEYVVAGFAESGKKRVEDMIALQTELFKYLQEVNRSWISHMQSEASLASEFAPRLTAARSIPETATACQEWANRRMELFTQDGRRLLADTEKLFGTGARLLANGWVTGQRPNA